MAAKEPTGALHVRDLDHLARLLGVTPEKAAELVGEAARGADGPHPAEGVRAVVGQAAAAARPVPATPIVRPVEGGGGDKPPGGAGGPQPVYGSEPVGGHGAETVRVLLDIRDAVRLILRKSAGGGADGPHHGGQEQGGSWLERVLRPVTDRLRGTRVGRAVDRAISKVPEPVRQAAGELKDRAVRAVGRRLTRRAVRAVRTPKGGTAPKATPVRGSVPASGAARAGAAGAGAGGGAAAGGSRALAAAGPPGIAIAVILAAAVALYKVGEAGKKLAHEQEDYARKLGQVSAHQAVIMAELDVNRQMRAIDKGENTAATSEKLMRSIDRYEAATQRWEESWNNLKNTVGAVVLEKVAAVVEKVEPLADILNEIAELISKIPGVGGREKKPEDEPTWLWEWMEGVQRDQDRKHAEGQRRIDRARDAGRR
jgi:hypothetical protein